MRFTIRDLLWVMTLMAAMSGWYRDKILMAEALDRAETKQAEERRSFNKQLAEMNKQLAQMWGAVANADATRNFYLQVIQQELSKKAAPKNP